MEHKDQKTILLVEDEAIIGMTEALQLKKYGYDVICVQSGEKAIESINELKPRIDIILMDINLGKGIDGPQTASMILKEHDLPIVFLSSHTEREIVDKTEDIASYGYVIKNSNIAVLNTSIKMAFRLHAAYSGLKNQKKEIEDKTAALKIYETRYRRLFETARDGILILNAKNGKIIDVNPFLVELLGFSKEEFLQKAIWDISSFNQITYSKQLFKELQEKEYVRYTDLPLETSDKRLIHVEFVSNVYLVDNDKVIQCNIRDIEARMQYEKKLTNSIAEKNALLKEIQHRTKNSFNMITSLINLRAEASSSGVTKSTLEELTLRVQSISDLYSLLYETESFYDVPLKEYCETIISSMLNLSSNISISKEMDAVIVSAKNAASIGMIIVELLSNAIKYAFPNNAIGIINLSLKQLNSNTKLIVEDNGIGIPNDLDLEKTNSIGLHLVDLLVKQLNGQIQVESKQGTKIIITF